MFGLRVWSVALGLALGFAAQACQDDSGGSCAERNDRCGEGGAGCCPGLDCLENADEFSTCVEPLECLKEGEYCDDSGSDGDFARHCCSDLSCYGGRCIPDEDVPDEDDEDDDDDDDDDAAGSTSDGSEGSSTGVGDTTGAATGPRE